MYRRYELRAASCELRASHRANAPAASVAPTRYNTRLIQQQTTTRDMTQPTATQLEIIERQLGRKPRGLVRIAAQTGDGIPLVLQMRSLVDDKPFPTLYWLSSKDLYRAIAEIETAGWVKQIEAEITQDAALREAYLQNQRDYVARRWAAMPDEDRQRIEALGFSGLFDKYGIGGIAQWDKVRCLHMQYAHYLVDGNVVGERMEQQFNLRRLPIGF